MHFSFFMNYLIPLLLLLLFWWLFNSQFMRWNIWNKIIVDNVGKKSYLLYLSTWNLRQGVYRSHSWLIGWLECVKNWNKLFLHFMCHLSKKPYKQESLLHLFICLSVIHSIGWLAGRLVGQAVSKTLWNKLLLGILSHLFKKSYE